MNRPMRALLVLAALLGLRTTAEAQYCPPSAVLCGRAGLPVVPGSRGAQLIITIGPPPVPQPPVVVVRPPPPQYVIVRPPPPPPPQMRYVAVPQGPTYARGRQDVRGVMGLRFFVAGAAGGRGSQAALGGVGAALRIRPREHFAVDLGAGFYAGTDHAGQERVEVPFTADFLAFVNPQHRAQFYMLAGVGTSFAYSRSSALGGYERGFTYVGAQGGMGLELRIRRGFALNFDARAFVRAQPEGAPEFQRTLPDGSLETSRTSAGGLGTAGMTIYF